MKKGTLQLLKHGIAKPIGSRFSHSFVQLYRLTDDYFKHSSSIYSRANSMKSTY